MSSINKTKERRPIIKRILASEWTCQKDIVVQSQRLTRASLSSAEPPIWMCNLDQARLIFREGNPPFRLGPDISDYSHRWEYLTSKMCFRNLGIVFFPSRKVYCTRCRRNHQYQCSKMGKRLMSDRWNGHVKSLDSDSLRMIQGKLVTGGKSRITNCDGRVG